MSQITIYLDDETETVLKKQVKASGESASKWITDAIKKRAQTESPLDILALFGSWKERPITRKFGDSLRISAPQT